MTKGEPHIDYNKFDTIKIGNDMAERIKAKGPRPNYSATLRHALTNNGVHAACELAERLLGINDASARAVIKNLSNSKPDDVWSPHDREE